MSRFGALLKLAVSVSVAITGGEYSIGLGKVNVVIAISFRVWLPGSILWDLPGYNLEM